MGGYPKDKDASDMDMSPDMGGENVSPSNSGNSQRGVSSQSSFSTPSDGQNKYGGGETSGVPSSNMGNNFNFAATGDEFDQLFYTSTSGVAEWDMSGGAGMTGLTPLPENAWTQMLDSGGWEGFGPSQGTDVFSSRLNEPRSRQK